MYQKLPVRLKSLTSPLIFIFLLLLSSCSGFYFPGVHKITVQQGNFVTRPMIDKLKPGMTKNQVIFVLGRPIVQDPLNDNRWDYVYTIQTGDKYQSQSMINLFFTNDRLDYFETSFLPETEFVRIKKSLVEKELSQDSTDTNEKTEGKTEMKAE